MNIKTHRKINNTFSGYPIFLEEGKKAVVELKTIEEMVADERGLVHGGFIFSAADYCAMITVNHPNVVLSKSEVKFLKPTKSGETLIFESNVIENKDNKYKILVEGKNKNGKIIFTGTFYCVITDKHVLENG